MISEHASESRNRQSLLKDVVGDVRKAFNAVRCVVYERSTPSRVKVVAQSEDRAVLSLPEFIPIGETWLKDVFAGDVVARHRITDERRDGFLRRLHVRSAFVAPLVVEGRIDHAVSLHYDAPNAFDETDVVLLRDVASHISLALTTVQINDLERLRRARAESLERVVRRLRDTQAIEEVVLVFAVSVSREMDATCAIYALEGNVATRRALRTVDVGGGGASGKIEAAELQHLLEQERPLQSGQLPHAERLALFGANEGIVLPLHLDGSLWGFVLLANLPDSVGWNDEERIIYVRTLASHLELALTGARGFERIQDLARELSESNEFKDDLLAMLAHDFKGPLTVILGYCELLLEDAPLNEREELETIYAQTKRLVRLSDDAVALAQTQAGGFSLDRSTVDLRQLVEESVKAHNRAGRRISVEMPAEPIRVSIDTARFNHVLDNLFMNALKYSDADVTVRLARTDGTATIAIVDRGIGIPQTELATVFTRFGRASNARRKGISGSGVGLYVSRKIVEVHGGSIAVTSSEGHGSTFTITLPLSGSARQPKA